jgi:hypothetical protein
MLGGENVTAPECDWAVPPGLIINKNRLIIHFQKAATMLAWSLSIVSFGGQWGVVFD